MSIVQIIIIEIIIIIIIIIIISTIHQSRKTEEIHLDPIKEPHIHL